MKNLSPINENKDVVTKEYVDPIKSQAAINRTTLGTQCKNLIDTQIDSQTYYGLTFKRNSDGSILINGTSTNASTAFLRIFKTYDVGKFINQKFILSATGSDNVGIQFDGRNSSGLQTCFSQAYSVDAKFTSNADFILLNIYLIIRAKSTFDNYTVYPMLRYADITDDTYEPYKESVDERITNNVSDIAINKSTLGYQRKNLFNPNAVNWYQPTKMSIAKDGTITSTITSDPRNWGYEKAEYFLTLSAGKYIVRTVTETIDDTASIYMGIKGYNKSGTQLFEIHPNVIGTKTTSFTLTETTTVAIMFKLFTQTCKIMIYDADITDDTYEPYQPSLVERCLLKDTAGINLGHAQSSSITIDNLSAYTALWVNVSGGVSGINFKTNLVVPVAYLAKSSSNRVSLAGGIPSSAYITSEGVLAAKYMDGTITAKVSGDTLDLTIGTGTIGSVEVISLM